MISPQYDETPHWICCVLQSSACTPLQCRYDAMEMCNTSTLNLGFSHFTFSWRFDVFYENCSAWGTCIWLDSTVLLLKVQIAQVFPFLSSELLGSTSWYQSQNELEIPQNGFSEALFLLKFIFSFAWLQITTFTRINGRQRPKRCEWKNAGR